MSNYGDIPEVGDFSDLAHVFAVPYVDAATLDRRMRHYCNAVSLKMVGLGSAADYSIRIYENLATLMDRNS